MANDENDITGRKIFFLYPPVVVQNDVIAELIEQEFEVYTVRDHEKLRRLLRRFNDSIVLINIDDQMAEKDWATWIQKLMADPSMAKISLGVLSSADDPALAQKYTTILKLPCGFTPIKSDLRSSIVHLMEALNAVDARGRRKYLRATSDNESLTTVNLPYNNMFVKGVIKDISAVGFSCAFEEDPEIEKNTLCQDIQIKLHTQLLKTEGIVFGNRMDGMTKIYVILFTQRIDPSVRTRIRRYIQSNIQAKIDLLMK